MTIYSTDGTAFLSLLLSLSRHPHAVRPVPAPVVGILLGRLFVMQDEHVFRIPLLGRLRKIIASRHNAQNIHHDKLVVHDLMFAVVADSHAVRTQTMPLCASGRPLAAIQYHPYSDVALSGPDERVGKASLVSE